ncbi:hypothetical protein AC578_6480 [Pseudocercospora eumusae]|uniref:Uncharacterized protein n=1 Tax=Pseudocercospora eumusae TaxID=321146 RepID=A0A139HD23_9PEZI|nr:hypothetical protein AC578_6480 [Pseudocercospora eumusae]
MAVTAKVEAKTAQVSASSIQPFLQPDFEPAEYLNTTLPTLSTTTAKSARALPFPELSSQLQTLLNQLNAQTTRLSQTLTQLTDEILRSGNRLAYEVEVLKSDTTTLTDTFQNALQKEISQLAPKHPQQVDGDEDGEADIEPEEEDIHPEPEFLHRLQTLTTVRSRLDTVIKTFGSAMQWPLPPSSVSNDEQKGKDFSETLRLEISEQDLDLASARVSELRELAEVWKGTAEEKARMKVVETLQRIVEEREKIARNGPAAVRGVGFGGDYQNPPARGAAGYGFLQNLRGLKGEG